MNVLLSYLDFLCRSENYAYFIETKSRLNNNHILHRGTCELLPQENGRLHLGNLFSKKTAIKKATKLYPQIKCCEYCDED